jgi:DNA-binding response OmpR family regulator
MRVLILEDDDMRIEHFKKRFPDAALDIVKHAEEAIYCLKENQYDIICLDHDLGDQQMEWDEEDCGMLVAEYLAENPQEHAKVIIHSFNTPRAMRMHYLIRGSNYFPGYWLGEGNILGNKI